MNHQRFNQLWDFAWANATTRAHKQIMTRLRDVRSYPRAPGLLKPLTPSVWELRCVPIP